MKIEVFQLFTFSDDFNSETSRGKRVSQKFEFFRKHRRKTVFVLKVLDVPLRELIIGASRASL
jgi:hypothetical protein